MFHWQSYQECIIHVENKMSSSYILPLAFFLLILFLSLQVKDIKFANLKYKVVKIQDAPVDVL